MEICWTNIEALPFWAGWNFSCNEKKVYLYLVKVTNGIFKRFFQVSYFFHIFLNFYPARRDADLVQDGKILLKFISQIKQSESA